LAFTAYETEQLRKALLKETRHCAVTLGMKKTSVDQLTKAVGIAKGSFYKFYESKEMLFFAVLEGIHAELYGVADQALREADGIAALALGVVEPLVAPDGDAGIVGRAELPAGAHGAFPLGAQQRHQVGILRPRLFLRREINKFSHPFFSVWIDVVPLAARGTLWYNFSP